MVRRLLKKFGPNARAPAGLTLMLSVAVATGVAFQNCSGFETDLATQNSKLSPNPPDATPTPTEGPRIEVSDVAMVLGESQVVKVKLVNLNRSYMINWNIIGGNNDFLETAGTFSAPASATETSFILRSTGLPLSGTKSYLLTFSPVAGTLPNVTVTVTVVDPTPPIHLSVGQNQTCITSAGVPKCWGYNKYGQLGTGDTSNRRVPTAVNGLDGRFVDMISTGGNSTCAVAMGALYCWGYNNYGQLGIGSTSNRTTPTLVPGMDKDVTSVSVGESHACAIKNGGLYCWGYNKYGQLGNGTTTNSTTPVPVTDLSDGVTAVSAGANTTCAIHYGSLRCWGYNNRGQVGDGSTTNRTTPVLVIDPSATVKSVSVGTEHTCAIVNDTARCWGLNSSGQIGDGTTTNRTLPTAVVGLDSDVRQIMAGHAHTCALVDGGVQCWGSGSRYATGTGFTNNLLTPSPVMDLATGVLRIATGANASHGCAIVENFKLTCWGRGDSGQIGVNSTSDARFPVTPFDY